MFAEFLTRESGRMVAPLKEVKKLRREINLKGKNNFYFVFVELEVNKKFN